MSRLIVVINGPNLNKLGKREPDVYGRDTLDDINARIAAHAKSVGLDVEFFQSNHEGDLIDCIHDAADSALGIVLNPGGLTHTSVALRDAVSSVSIPVIEVHISNIFAREPFRHRSMVSGACRGVISGLGATGYILAVDYLKSISA